MKIIIRLKPYTRAWKKRRKLLILAFMVCFLVIYLYTPSSTDKDYNKGEIIYLEAAKVLIKIKVILVWLRILGEDVACHYEESDPGLPVADASFNPPARSIFFHETSCCLDLNSRQACAVESAARMHPGWQINLLIAGTSKYALIPGSCLSTLMKIPNVKVLRVHIVEYAKGTPLESIVERGAVNNSIYRISHTSDVLRYISLYKYGGIYMDLDVVVVKPLDHLEWNFSVREPNTTAVGAGVMSFSRNKLGREIADACIRDMASNFSVEIWNHNGPGVITRVLRKRCNTNDTTKMTLAQCNGFQVYEPKYFYPVEYRQRLYYFKPGKIIVKEEEYTHHVWNADTKNVKVHPNSPYAKLAKKYCPNIYRLFNDQFGT